MEESAELFCDKSWFQIMANCKIFAQDLRNMKNFRYESCKSRWTTTVALEQNIKTAALEAFVPSELEQQLAMNRAPLVTYEQGRRSQLAFKTVATKITSDPMEVDTFGKGGKKGKNGKKGKGEGKSVKKVNIRSRTRIQVRNVVCWHCGQKGHLSIGYWSNPKNQFDSCGTQNKGGKEEPKQAR